MGATEDNRISSQPEAEELIPPRDVVISPWLLAGASFASAWFLLGWLTVSGYSILTVHEAELNAALRNPQWLALMAVSGIPLDPSLLEMAAVVLVWVAFLRPAWSDRLLFSAAMVLASTVFLGGIDYLSFKMFHHTYGSTIVTTVVVAYGMLLASARASGNRPLTMIAMLLIAWGCEYPLVWRMATPVAVVGGILLACAIFCFGFFMAERAGVKPFATLKDGEIA